MPNEFTPGPWAIESMSAKHVNTHAIVISADDGLGPVAYATSANARLIAAAPTMLLALRRAVLALAFASETSKAMRDDYEFISKVIEEATGAAA